MCCLLRRAALSSRQGIPDFGKVMHLCSRAWTWTAYISLKLCTAAKETVLLLQGRGGSTTQCTFKLFTGVHDGFQPPLGHDLGLGTSLVYLSGLQEYYRSKVWNCRETESLPLLPNRGPAGSRREWEIWMSLPLRWAQPAPVVILWWYPKHTLSITPNLGNIHHKSTRWLWCTINPVISWGKMGRRRGHSIQRKDP